jgi:hypothetical protein
VQATGTDTYEINRNLVLTDGARADSVPNLEIETGEVAGAGHASATGRFDDEQLFYLMARGIPEAEARKLVVRGFFAELINKIPVEELRERLGASVWSPGSDGEPPEGVEAYDGGEDGEAALWVAEHGAVVVGDALLVRERLEVPVTWVPKGMTLAEFKQRLEPLLELAVELVLVTHGEPVRENGGEELRRALVESSS